MATHKFYFTSSLASGSTIFGALQLDGSAPATSTSLTGWGVFTKAATLYATMQFGSTRNTLAFTSTVQPSAPPGNVIGDCLRSSSTLTGTFASGAWSLSFSMIATVAVSGSGLMSFRIYKSTDPTGQTNVTRIDSGTNVSTSISNLTTTTPQVITASITIPATTFVGEYLFVQIAWEITAPSANGSATPKIQIGANSVITSTDFTIDAYPDDTVPAPAFSPPDYPATGTRFTSFYLPEYSGNTFSGSAVSTIADISVVKTGGDLTQSTSANQPLYDPTVLAGGPCANFVAVGDWMSASASNVLGTTGFTAFLVFQTTNTPGSEQLIFGKVSGDTSWGFFLETDGTVHFKVKSTLIGNVSSSVAVNDGAIHVFIAWPTGSAVSMTTDNNAAQTATYSGSVHTTTDLISIGANVAAGAVATNTNLIGNFGAGGTYNATITSGERASLLASAQAHWVVTAPSANDAASTSLTFERDTAETAAITDSIIVPHVYAVTVDETTPRVAFSPPDYPATGTRFNSFYFPSDSRNTVGSNQISTLKDISVVKTGGDMSQATTANQPTLDTSCLNGASAMIDTAAASTWMSASASNLFGSGTFTAFIVISTLSTPGSSALIFGKQSADASWIFALTNTGAISFSLKTSVTTYSLTSSTALNDGKVHVLIATLSGGQIKLSVDGGSALSQSVSGTAHTSTDKISIGGYVDSSNAQSGVIFDGIIGACGTYNTALTSGEQTTLLNGALAYFVPTVIVAETLTPSTDYIRTLSTDSIAVTDSAAASMTFERDTTDSVSVSDSIIRELQPSARDTCAATDTCSTSMVINSPIVSDAVSLSDSVVKSLQYSISISDTTALTDSSSTSLDYSKSATDSVSVTDSVFVELIVSAIDVAVSDAISVTDAVQSSLDIGSPITSDSISVTDSTSTSREINSSASDSISASDAIAIQVEPSASDTCSITDQTVLSLQYNISKSDSVSVTDAVADDLEINSTASDSCSVTDAISLSDQYSISVTDSVSVTDATQPSLEFNESSTDSISVSDQIIRELEPSAKDSISVSDQTTLTIEYSTSVTETITVTDAVTAQTTSLIDITAMEAADVSDELIASTEYERTDSDSLSVSDQFSASLELQVTLTDSIAASDQVQTDLQYNRTNSDSCSLTDSTIEDCSYIRDQSDAISLTDQINVDRARDVQASDAISTSDSAFIDLFFDANQSDAISTSDSVGLQFEIQLTDAIAITDAITTSLNFSINASDAISVTDFTQASLQFQADISDALSTSDSTSTSIEYQRANSDVIVTTDEATAQTLLIVDVSDAINVADSTSTSLELQRDTADTIAAADSITAQLVVNAIDVSASDTIAVTDQTQTELFLNVTNSETADTTDALNESVEYIRRANDSVTITDAIVRFSDATIADVCAVTDSRVASTQYSRDASDAISITDSAFIDLLIEVSASDSITTIDFTVRDDQFNPSLFDALTADDVCVASTQYDRSDTDACDVADTTAAEDQRFITLTDVIAVTDSLTATEEFERDVTDSIAVTDSLTASTAYERSATDSVSVTDVAIASREFVETASDAISVTDTESATLFADRANTDSAIVEEQFAIALEYAIAIADANSAVDSATADILREVTLSDACSVTDSLNASRQRDATASDVLLTSETLALTIEFYRDLLDANQVTDVAIVERQHIVHIFGKYPELHTAASYSSPLIVDTDKPDQSALHVLADPNRGSQLRAGTMDQSSESVVTITEHAMNISTAPNSSSAQQPATVNASPQVVVTKTDPSSLRIKSTE